MTEEIIAKLFRQKGLGSPVPHGRRTQQLEICGGSQMKYKIEDLTKEEAGYIGEKINGIVPREVDAEEEEFVLKIENETGEIIGGCIATAYEYHWSRMFLNDLWVDERYRHHGIGSMILHEVERIAREKGCRVVTLGTASFMARPFYEKHGYTVFTTLKKPNGYLSYSLVKYLDRDTLEYVPSNNSGARFVGQSRAAARKGRGAVGYGTVKSEQGGCRRRVDIRHAFDHLYRLRRAEHSLAAKQIVIPRPKLRDDIVRRVRRVFSRLQAH